MVVQNLYKELTDRMDKAIEVYKHELSTIRTGVASTALVEHLMVDSYGVSMPLNQLATISIPEPSCIVIQPWDQNLVSVIEKAIFKSDLGLTPNNDGKVIRIVLPPLSEERREELIKVIRKISEESKVAVRNIRRDGNDKIKKLQKNKEVTEDEEKKGFEEIQKFTDSHIEKINSITKHKEEELLKV